MDGTGWVLCKGCMHCIMFDMVIEPLPSTMIVALDNPELWLKHFTNDWLFSDVTLWIVMLAGLANSCVSSVLTWGNLSPVLGASFWLRSGIPKSTVQSKIPPMLLLQVNVTFPLSGTTYPPGIGSASADRVTVRARRHCPSLAVQNVMPTDIAKLTIIQTYLLL